MQEVHVVRVGYVREGGRVFVTITHVVTLEGTRSTRPALFYYNGA